MKILKNLKDFYIYNIYIKYIIKIYIIILFIKTSSYTVFDKF